MTNLLKPFYDNGQITDTDLQDISAYLQNVFKPLGADVQLLNTDAATVTAAQQQGKTDVSMTAGNGGGNPEPEHSLLQYFVGPSIATGKGYNVLGPLPSVDPTWSSLALKAFGATGCKYWNQLQEYALKNYILRAYLHRLLVSGSRQQVDGEPGLLGLRAVDDQEEVLADRPM